jgi:hypothetical protein
MKTVTVTDTKSGLSALTGLVPAGGHHVPTG